MNLHVLLAVFRRNFVSYFANPTGYVFICLFVLLGAIAAFWVPDFFGNNLANLDQLSFWFPFIMLIYIPTITMGIWADERKQGTDELLLTIPAADFDIVLGKYLAALAIFSVSLLFSLLCNYFVLNNLASTDTWIALTPRLDLGLFLGTYVGYWLVGLAMLAIGGVASFLTGNITIAFVLGVLFNMPLVFLTRADAIFGVYGQEGVLAVKRWSIGQQFHDFGRGVLSLAGFVYFLMILVVMLYASMTLIGRRHWFSGRGRWVQGAHFFVRGLALAVVALGIVVVIRAHDVRIDVTTERLSSVAPQTRDLIEGLTTERPVKIEAFISPSVPEAYVQTRLNLRSLLDEIRAVGGDNVKVIVHDTDRFSPEAALAEKRYGIEPRQVATLNHGVYSVDNVFLHVAVGCGSRRVPPAFIDRDTPVEYELVRSICTVSDQKRKRIGVVRTDAPLYGSINFQTMQPTQNWPIIDELEKQYEVVQVDPTKPITEKFDALLAVQPSTLGPQEMDNFVAAVAAGVPTAIFEDPAPMLCDVPASSMPRKAPGGGMMMMMQRQAPPKGDVRRLWNLLGVDYQDSQVIWQDYNPYTKIPDFTRDKEFVFIDSGSGVKDAFIAPKDTDSAIKKLLQDRAFNPWDPISSGLQQMLFPFPGATAKRNTSDLEFTPLAVTGDRTGTVGFRDLVQMSPMGGQRVNPQRPIVPTGVSYTLAARIRGKTTLPPSNDDPFKLMEEAKKKQKKGEKTAVEANVNVVLTTDIDMLTQAFFMIREQGDNPQIGVHFRFDNVTFILNALDELAGDDRFIEIRKRRSVHHPLARVEEQTKDAKKEAADSREKYSKKYEEQEKAEQKLVEDKLADLRSRKNIDTQQMLIEVGLMQQDLERQREAKLEQLRREKEREENKIDTDLALKVRTVQDKYKLWAVLLPPILPLVLALIVFFARRAREREGVAKSRLR